MMRYLNLVEVLDLHSQIIEQSKGAMGIRDLGSFSAVKVIALWRLCEIAIIKAGRSFPDFKSA